MIGEASYACSKRLRHSVVTGEAFDGHECGEDSLASAIIKWLCVPVDCWPTSLPWTCGSCHSVQEGRVCASCPGSSRIRALLLLLQGLAYTLQAILPIIPHTPATHLDMDDLISILLSPHGNRMTGLLTGAYNIQAAQHCVCVEEEGGLLNSNDSNLISTLRMKTS